METWTVEGDLRAYKLVPAHPRAVVVLVHGFGEHAGRHAATIDAFGRRGIAVYTYDQRGHGRSPGRRAFVARFDEFVDDLLAIREHAAALHPDVPLFLLGASMGGVLVLRSAQREPKGLAGVVLIAPALSIGASTPALVRALGSVISFLAPMVPVAKLELRALSRDQAVVDAYAADPLTYHGGVPARTGAELLAAAALALRQARALHVPALFLHGEADRIAAPEGSQRFVAAARRADVTLRLVPGAYHEPFNEPGGPELVSDVASWILAR